MGKIRQYRDWLKQKATKEERIIVYMFSSIFLPWWLTCVITISISIYILRKYDIKALIQQVRHAWVLFLFFGYLMIMTLLNQSWLVSLTVVAFVLMSVNVIFYRRYITKPLFERILDIALVLSFVAFIYSLFEQGYYAYTGGVSYFYIQNAAEVRVHSFYFNANYYAYVIMIFLAMAVYKFIKADALKVKAYYVVLCLVNIFCLYLTGTRTGWVALAGSMVVMLFIAHWYKTTIAAFGFAGICCVYIAKHPSIIPRLTQVGLSFGRRLQIWHAAWLMIQDHWLFGMGAMGYYTHYAQYEAEFIETYGLAYFEEYSKGIATEHAHSIFLEPFISFGLVGTLILLFYLVYEVKCMVKLWWKQIDIHLAALIIAVTVMSLLFSIVDFPFWWIQTGYLFFLILGSSDIYRDALQK